MSTSRSLSDDLRHFVPELVCACAAHDVDTQPPCYFDIDAALVFLDISGYTSLTERLTAEAANETLGPKGAEKVRDLLSAYFSKLLTTLRSGGGDVIKFAGDALMVLFYDPALLDALPTMVRATPRAAVDDGNSTAAAAAAAAAPAAATAKTTPTHSSDATADTTTAAATSTTHIDAPDASLSEAAAEIAAGTVARATRCAADACAIEFTRDGIALASRAAVGFARTRVFFVGSEQRVECLLAGDALPQVAATLDATTGPRQVLVSARAWAAARGALRGAPLDGASGAYRFEGVEATHAASAALSGEQSERRAAAVRVPSAQVERLLAPFVPLPVAAALRAALARSLYEISAEIRNVTVIFINVGAVRADNVESCVWKMNAAVQCVLSVLARFGGVLRQAIIDDKGAVIIGAFGVPNVPGAEPGSELEAAIDIAQRLSAPDVDAQATLGVASGKVYCGNVGASERHEYALVGDAVNTSARLMNAARRLDAGLPILCDRTTRDMCPAVEFVQETQPIKVKGKQQVVEVFQPRVVDRQMHASARSIDELSRRMRQVSREGSRTNAAVGGKVLSPRGGSVFRTAAAAARLKSSARAGVMNRAAAATEEALSSLTPLSINISGTAQDGDGNSDAASDARGVAANAAAADDDDEGEEDELLPATSTHSFFFGREKEMKVLHDAFAPIAAAAEAKSGNAAAAVPARAVIVNGEAGMGKSALLLHFCAAIQDTADFVAVFCTKLTENVAYSFWSEFFSATLQGDAARAEKLLRAADADVDDGLLDLLPLLAEVGFTWAPNEHSEHIAGSERARALHTLVGALFNAVVRTHSASVLVIEDGHWMDNESLVVLKSVLTAGDDKHVPVLVLVAARIDADDLGAFGERAKPLRAILGAARTTMCAVGGLEDEHILSLAGVSVPLPVGYSKVRFTDELSRTVLAKSSGSPFYCSEFVNHLFGNKIVELHTDASESGVARVAVRDSMRSALLDLPPSVEKLITSRVDKLNAKSQYLLKILSVFGQEFTVHPDVGTVLPEQWREGRELSRPKLERTLSRTLSGFLTRQGSSSGDLLAAQSSSSGPSGRQSPRAPMVQRKGSFNTASGRTSPLNLIADNGGGGGGGAARLAAVTEDITSGGGDTTVPYRFQNALTQQVVYDLLSYQMRSELHCTIAKMFVARGGVRDEVIAFHFKRGGDARQACHHFARAAHKAHTNNAKGIAFQFCTEYFALCERAQPPLSGIDTAAMRCLRGKLMRSRGDLRAANEDFVATLRAVLPDAGLMPKSDAAIAELVEQGERDVASVQPAADERARHAAAAAADALTFIASDMMFSAMKSAEFSHEVTESTGAVARTAVRHASVSMATNDAVAAASLKDGGDSVRRDSAKLLRSSRADANALQLQFVHMVYLLLRVSAQSGDNETRAQAYGAARFLPPPHGATYAQKLEELAATNKHLHAVYITWHRASQEWFAGHCGAARDDALSVVEECISYHAVGHAENLLIRLAYSDMYACAHEKAIESARRGATLARKRAQKSHHECARRVEIWCVLRRGDLEAARKLEHALEADKLSHLNDIAIAHTQVRALYAQAVSAARDKAAPSAAAWPSPALVRQAAFDLAGKGILAVPSFDLIAETAEVMLATLPVASHAQLFAALERAIEELCGVADLHEAMCMRAAFVRPLIELHRGWRAMFRARHEGAAMMALAHWRDGLSVWERDGHTVVMPLERRKLRACVRAFRGDDNDANATNASDGATRDDNDTDSGAARDMAYVLEPHLKRLANVNSLSAQ